MAFENWAFAFLAAAVAGAIYLTTPRGRRLAEHFNLPTPSRRKGRAPSEDMEYLLRVCGGDLQRVGHLIDEARQHDPSMTEAAAYRKAIRKVMRSRPETGPNTD